MRAIKSEERSIAVSTPAITFPKFPSITDDRAVTKAEVLALHLAKAAGINASQARVVHSRSIPVALVQRFDRTGDGRLTYASAATLLGAQTGDGEEHTYAEIVDVIRQHGADVQADVEELWRRIAFYILITNVDDHLHNLGFLHVARGQWQLAPAFDVNPFPERVRELKTWISEEAGPAASIEALMAAAPYFALDSDRAVEVLAHVERAVSKWRALGERLG